MLIETVSRFGWCAAPTSPVASVPEAFTAGAASDRRGEEKGTEVAPPSEAEIPRKSIPH
ncbi:MAG: hypothetical protein ACREEM_05630 [Blastocatellia bacterium]